MVSRSSGRPEASSLSKFFAWLGTKTWKREVGIFMVGVLTYVALKAAAYDGEGTNQALETLKALIVWFMAYVAAAFGLDALAKQTSLLKR